MKTTPERPAGSAARDPAGGEGIGEAVDAHHLWVFVSDELPASPAAVRRALLEEQAADADIAIARFERALRRAPQLDGGTWAAPPRRLSRGVRLHVARDAAVDTVVEIEKLARAQGLATLDEEIGEVTFTCPLGARLPIVAASRVLCAAREGYLLIEGGPSDRYFVQAFVEAGSPEVLLQAVGNRGLEHGSRLGRAQAAALARHGWKPPRGAELNFSRALPLASPAAARELARLCRGALSEAYELPDSAPITICLALD